MITPCPAVMKTTSNPAIARAIPSLTGIRGVAVVWVVLFHLSLSAAPNLLGWSALSDFPLFSLGWTGVNLFFVLSGFILMYSHGSDFTCLEKSDLNRFRLERLFRIYPLHWVVLGLILLLCAFDHAYWTSLNHWSIHDNPRQAFIRSVLLGTVWLPGNGSYNEPIWSLSAEIVAYAFFPVIAIALNRLHQSWLTWVVAGLALMLLFVCEACRGTLNGSNSSTMTAISRMGFCFVAGAALARLRVLEPTAPKRLAGMIGIVAVGALVLSISLGSTSLLPAGFALLIFSLSYEVGPINRICCCAPIHFLGQISFSIYLIHTQAIAWMEAHQPRQGVGWLVGASILLVYFVAVVFLSWVLFSCVEKPFHRLGKSLARS